MNKHIFDTVEGKVFICHRDAITPEELIQIMNEIDEHNHQIKMRGCCDKCQSSE